LACLRRDRAGLLAVLELLTRTRPQITIQSAEDGDVSGAGVASLLASRLAHITTLLALADAVRHSYSWRADHLALSPSSA